jgi:hypothetical protein
VSAAGPRAALISCAIRPASWLRPKGFDLGNGASTDIVTISAPVFFVKTPELFVDFLKTVATGDKDKLNAFFAAHPESTGQNAWLMSHPVPASYAGVGYWGVHAFTFTNPAGEQTLFKYHLIPEAGELGLTPDEAKAKGPDFYADEFKERLAKGPVLFDLWRSWASRATRPAIPRYAGMMKIIVRRRRSARSASRQVPSSRGMSRTESLAQPTIRSSQRVHRLTSCPSRGGRRREAN